MISSALARVRSGGCAPHAPLLAGRPPQALGAGVSLCVLLAAACGGDRGQGRTPRDNLYLAEVVDWDPRPCGAARNGEYAPGIIDASGMPILNDLALGAPLGAGCGASGMDVLVTGINGSVTFRFAPGRHIHDGPGDDFVTFEGRFAWGCVCDSMVNELAHVQVSEDGETWYHNTAEAYDENSTPGEENDGYVYASVQGLHGNNPTWANPEREMPAQEVVAGKWVDLLGSVVPPDFGPETPHLGGDPFDLATFQTLDGDPWPADGRLRFLRIVDDSTILDGQDSDPPWSTGAQVQAAMGLNVREDTP